MSDQEKVKAKYPTARVHKDISHKDGQLYQVCHRGSTGGTFVLSGWCKTEKAAWASARRRMGV